MGEACPFYVDGLWNYEYYNPYDRNILYDNSGTDNDIYCDKKSIWGTKMAAIDVDLQFLLCNLVLF